MTKSIKLFSFLSMITTFSQAADFNTAQPQNTRTQSTQPQRIELISPQQDTVKRNADHAETIGFLSCFLEHKKTTDAHFNFLAHIIRDKEKELKKNSLSYKTLATRLNASLTLSTQLLALTDQEIDFKRKAHQSKINQLAAIEKAHRDIYSKYRELLTLQNKYRAFFYQDQNIEEQIRIEQTEAQNRQDLAHYLQLCFREKYEISKRAEEYIRMIEEKKASDLEIDSALKLEEEIRNEQLLEQYEKSIESESKQASRLYIESYGWDDSDDDEEIIIYRTSTKTSPKKRGIESATKKSPKRMKIQSPSKPFPQEDPSFADENDENTSPNAINKRTRLPVKMHGLFSPVQKASSITSNGTTDNELSSQSSIEYRTLEISQDY